MLLEVDRDKLKMFIRPRRRKKDFVPYFEPFRSLNESELQSLARIFKNWQNSFSSGFVSYQALTGGFTICNIIVNGQLYTGSSHCSKVDRWLPIRGQMLAFKRALESTGITLPVNLPNDVNSGNEF